MGTPEGVGAGIGLTIDPRNGVPVPTGNSAREMAAALAAAGGKVVFQEINTLHPGDPAVHKALASSAAQGFSAQGHRSSNVERSGL
jgi:hypothetical protein